MAEISSFSGSKPVGSTRKKGIDMELSLSEDGETGKGDFCPLNANDSCPLPSHSVLVSRAFFTEEGPLSLSSLFHCRFIGCERDRTDFPPIAMFQRID